MNEQKKLERIEPHDKLLSQRLVEECMIAANRCCARFLRDTQSSGPFVRHRGFRQDRKDEIQRFLSRFLPEYTESDLGEVRTYREIMARLAADPQPLPLRAMANRLLARAELDTAPGAHMGMALECYSNCTSPLRKFTDFLAQRQIKAALHGEPADRVSKAQLKALAERLSRARQAAQEAERWLQCEFLQSHVGEECEAAIVHVNSGGFNARLLQWGIDGHVDLRKDPEKFSFDRWTASLSSASRRFQLEQAIRVRIERVEVENLEIALVPLTAEAAEPVPQG